MYFFSFRVLQLRLIFSPLTGKAYYDVNNIVLSFILLLLCQRQLSFLEKHKEEASNARRAANTLQKELDNLQA